MSKSKRAKDVGDPISGLSPEQRKALADAIRARRVLLEDLDINEHERLVLARGIERGDADTVDAALRPGMERAARAALISNLTTAHQTLVAPVQAAWPHARDMAAAFRSKRPDATDQEVEEWCIRLAGAAARGEIDRDGPDPRDLFLMTLEQSYPDDPELWRKATQRSPGALKTARSRLRKKLGARRLPPP